MSIRKASARCTPAARFVVCVENAGYPASLKLHKLYRVLPDAGAAKDGDIRIADESDDDPLYPADWLVALDLPQRVKTSLLRRLAQPQSA